MKRVLTIQDISCLGKCSITVALPLISAMGVETVILPSAVLSAHTMFENFTVKDLTDQFEPICKHWKEQDVKFDAIYTGYLGSKEQMDLVRHIIKEFGGDDTLIFIDPVMADHGKLYPAFDEAYVQDLLQKLAKLGAKTVVLTGIGLEEGKNGVYGLDTVSGEYFSYINDNVGASYHGTGDVFSSVSVGGLMRGLSLHDAFALAADYTVATIRATLENPKKPWYGVDFETTIPQLVNDLAKKLQS